ncbi:MAG: hypothetical protein KBS41_00425, partial [Oscillospiraceae bacterium]|nr:hypothetical protein [Candidatus Equicaccousia limihippi]
MQFCLFKTRFYISYYFIVFIGLITVCDKTAVFLPVILSAAVHETGHLVAMKIFGCRLLRIELYPFL